MGSWDEISSNQPWIEAEAKRVAELHLRGHKPLAISEVINNEFFDYRSPRAISDAIRRNKMVLRYLKKPTLAMVGATKGKVASPGPAKNPKQVFTKQPETRDPMASEGLKTAYFDIECWDLNGSYGPLLCVSILDQNRNTMLTFRQDEYVASGRARNMTDDEALACDARDHLEQFHLTAGWFSKGFDIPHLNTRLAKWGARTLALQLHIDGIWYFKGWRGLKPVSSKLKHVAEFLELPEQKPSVHPDVWLMARAGVSTAMDEVVERCEADVRITRLCIDRALDMNLIRQISRYP